MSKDRDNWCLPCKNCGQGKMNVFVSQWNPWPGPVHCDHCRDNDPTLSLKIFGRSHCCEKQSVVCAAPPVTVVNPWNCREKATVFLGIDECGNLVVSVKKDGCC